MTTMNDVYQDAYLWWKAEALLQVCGQGAPGEKLIFASMLMTPIPHDVAIAHMKKAKAAILAHRTTTE